MVAPNPAILHQSYQGIPGVDAPLTVEGETINIPWYRLLMYLSNVTGNGHIPQTSSLQLTSIFGPPTIVDNQGNVIGTVPIVGNGGSGGDEQIQAVGSSPFVFDAPAAGNLLVNGAQLEFKRNAGYHVVSLVGGMIPLLGGDSARVTWFGPAPEVVWFPNI